MARMADLHLDLHDHAPLRPSWGVPTTSSEDFDDDLLERAMTSARVRTFEALGDDQEA